MNLKELLVIVAMREGTTHIIVKFQKRLGSEFLKNQGSTLGKLNNITSNDIEGMKKKNFIRK